MLYNFISDIKKNNIAINGILHVGAHDGGELNTYIENNIDNVIFVEANPVIYERLVDRCRSQSNVVTHTFNVGISNKKQQDVAFYITNNDSASSSILKLKEHMFEYPNINVVKNIKIDTTTIDDLFADNNLSEEKYNVLNMDIQGAEALALLGAMKYLKKCEAIYLEVNFREMYKECGLINDIDMILNSYSFKRIKVIDTGRGWGDALYIKEKK
jgi:FkbM family methyltransferase